MSLVRSLVTVSILTVTATGCGTQDDDIWMPPSGSGKADGVSILKGSDIPSQYVDASKHYLAGRTIDSLVQVGALTGVPASVAMRADGIIANLPANGRIEAAELVRMETPSIYKTLFPEEQMALPALWPLLEAPDPTPMTVPAPQNDLTVTEQLTPPSGLTPPASILISTLPTDLQTLARRVELVFDGDSNAATIQVADIDQVLMMPQAFTPTEVNQLGTIKGIFHERATSVESAVLVVPTPGTKTNTTNVGALKLEFTTNVGITETRSLSIATYSTSWSGDVILQMDAAGTLYATAADAAVMIDLDSGAEYVLKGAQNALPALGAGDYVVERWVSGQRQETHDAALAAFRPGTTRTDLAQYIDYDFQLANHTPLVKNAVSTTSSAGSLAATYRYDTSPFTTPGVDQNIVDRLATPALNLPTGHYEIPITGGTFAIDLYPQHVLIETFGGHQRMRYDGPYFVAAGTSFEAGIDTANRLYVRQGYHDLFDGVVTPAMRTK